MAKYIHLFDTDAEFQAMYNDDEKYIEPWASYTRETESCDYNKKPGPETMPLRMEFLDDTEIYFFDTDLPYEDVKLSKNGGEWVSATAYTLDEPLSISAGDTLEWVGDYECYYDTNGNPRLSINVTEVDGGNEYWLPRVKLSGNIMSLINSTGFSGVFDFTQPHVFGGYDPFIFGSFSLADISELVLPATGLTDYCYVGLFSRSSWNYADTFTTAPALPATTLADYCYETMFLNCSSLITTPALPATTLAINCYCDMFCGCSSLTTAPELPATTLAGGCYYEMFRYCSSLNSIACLATDISAEECTSYWVDGVSSTGTFTKAASMSSWTTGESGIPDGWTVVPAQ